MRAPRGFGKNYFSLASIQAHTSSVSLHSKMVRTLPHITFSLDDSSEDALDSPPDGLFCTELSKEPDSRRQVKKPCFCNIFFKNKSRISLKLAYINQAPLCKCRKTKSGISPPSLLITQLKIIII